ncbi:hypothetical protein KY362_00060 [Candidatus Woesearchaeota archaeon]|nr:hypothetical protein [Candidatus Woesearchaeota archaeon]
MYEPETRYSETPRALCARTLLDRSTDLAGLAAASDRTGGSMADAATDSAYLNVDRVFGFCLQQNTRSDEEHDLAGPAAASAVMVYDKAVRKVLL